jgi:hypothetical protein
MNNVTSNVTKQVEWWPARYPLKWASSPEDVLEFDPLRQIYTRGENFGPYLQGSALLGFSPYAVLTEDVTPQWIQLKEAPKQHHNYPCLVRATPYDSRAWRDKYFSDAPQEPVYKVLRNLFKEVKDVDSLPTSIDKNLLKQVYRIATNYGLLNPYQAQNTLRHWIEAGIRCYCFVRIKGVLDKLVSDENEGEKVKLIDLRDQLCKSLELKAEEAREVIYLKELNMERAMLLETNPLREGVDYKVKHYPWLTQNMNLWWSRQAEDIASQVLRIFLKVKTVKGLRAKLRDNLDTVFAAGLQNRLDYARRGQSYHFVARVGINTWLAFELANLLYSSEQTKPCLYCGEELELTPQTAKQNYCNDAHKQAAYRERRFAKTV